MDQDPGGMNPLPNSNPQPGLTGVTSFTGGPGTDAALLGLLLQLGNPGAGANFLRPQALPNFYRQTGQQEYWVVMPNDPDMVPFDIVLRPGS